MAMVTMLLMLPMLPFQPVWPVVIMAGTIVSTARKRDENTG